MWDVVVAGAGPAGTNVARGLANVGFQVLVLEEHPTVGDPVACAGLVTPRLFDHIPIAMQEVAQNELRGGIVYSPDGTRLEFESDRVQAVIMDRGDFDRRMAQEAIDAGATLWTKAKLTDYQVHASHVEIRLLDGRTIQSKFLVGADGVRSKVARIAGLEPIPEIISAYEADVSGCHIAEDQTHMIPMFAGRGQAPGFFSWIIPITNTLTRTGVAVAPDRDEGSAKLFFERMFEDAASKPYLEGGTVEHLIIGAIPLGLRPRITADRLALVGDAAGMAKPTSGGGIYMAVEAGNHLVDVLATRLAKDRLHEPDLARYEQLVRQGVGRELRRGGQLRALYKRFTDEDLNAFARLLAVPRVRRVIEARGDIDYVSKLVLPVVARQPRLAWLFAKVLLRSSA